MKLIIIISCVCSVISEELCILKKSRCPPESMHDCVGSNEEYEAKEDFGYEGLGCFSTRSPWSGLLRPFPTPDPPAVIDTHIYLYTRAAPERLTVHLWPSINITGLDFNEKRKTAFLIHGYSSHGSAEWLTAMSNAYLTKENANVFVIDWEKGSAIPNYFKAASNTRIVGAELARFIKYLKVSQKLNPNNVHLIGHSLGSHIAAYAAKAIKGIGRITALDPAQPGFEGTDERVRLAKGDAGFIDVIHTNAKPFIPFLGFGMMAPVGDVDFYMNGGMLQPGCTSSYLKSIKSLKDILGKDLRTWITCSHKRACQYFTAALESSCMFIGKKMGGFSRFTSAVTFGRLGTTPTKSCNANTCIPLGLDTPRYPARGSFEVNTTKDYPFCNTK